MQSINVWIISSMSCACMCIHVFNIVLGLAYAVLANLDPVYGLYTAIVPVIVYSIFGTSRHVSIGRRKRINL